MIANDKERIILTIRKQHASELDRIAGVLDLTKSQLIGQMLTLYMPQLQKHAKDVRSANEKMKQYSKGKR